RRQAAAASATYDSRAVDADAAGRARAQERATFQRGDGLAAQHARQLHPFGSTNARASLNELCGHCSYGNLRTPSYQSGISPIATRTLVPGAGQARGRNISTVD